MPSNMDIVVAVVFGYPCFPNFKKSLSCTEVSVGLPESTVFTSSEQHCTKKVSKRLLDQGSVLNVILIRIEPE